MKIRQMIIENRANNVKDLENNVEDQVDNNVEDQTNENLILGE